MICFETAMGNVFMNGRVATARSAWPITPRSAPDFVDNGTFA